MNFLKSMKWNMIVSSIFSIILGVVLIAFPDTSLFVIVNIIAIAFTAGGIASIIRYFTYDLRESLYRNDFLAGVICLAIGLLLFINPGVIVALVPFVLAIFVMISGFIKLQDGIDAYRMGYKNSFIYILLAVLSIAAGLIIMFNLFETASLLFIFIGASLVYTGISDIFATLYLSRKLHEYYKDLDEKGSSGY